MADQKKQKEFRFRYVFPDDLRDYYVNGCWGGFTPRNEIYMHLYSERQPIPIDVVHKVKDDGTLSEKPKLEVGGDVVRLIQASTVIDIHTAEAIRDWLDGMINQLKKRQKEETEH